jgi:hypothetical protein
MTRTTIVGEQRRDGQVLTGSFAGKWWLPKAKKKALFGVLSLAHDRLSLDLVGSYEPIQLMGSVTAYPVIHGTATDGKAFTLVNGLVVNESLNTRAFDVRATQLRPSAVLVGGHLADPVDARFGAAALELERMTAWASPSGFRREIKLTPDRHAKSFSFEYTVPDNVVAEIPGARITIGPGQQTVGDLIHEAGLRVAVEAQLTFERATTVDAISQAYLKPLEDLLVLATQLPTTLVSFRVSPSARAPFRWIEVIQQRLASDGAQSQRLTPHDALFLLPDLLDAAPDALARWFKAAAVLERPFELVSAVRSTPRLFLDHRFINAATAAESYHEARIGGAPFADDVWKQIVGAAVAAAPQELARLVRDRMSGMKKPSFRDRIEGLLERGGPELRSLLPDPAGVAKRASALRNPLAHGTKTGRTSRELFDATDELLLILEFHFLCEAGFSGEAAAARLRSASRSYSGLWLRSRDRDADGASGSAALG